MGMIQRRQKQIKLISVEKRIEKLKSSIEPKENLLFQVAKPFDVIDQIIEDIGKLGKPFVRHKPGTKIYDSVFKKTTLFYRKYGKKFVDPFLLAQEYFNNPKFVYHPGSISIADFIRFSPNILSRSHYTKRFSVRYGVNSLFNEFLKGKDHIDANFLVVKVAKQDIVLVNELKDIWNRFKPKLEEKDSLSISQFIANCSRFSEENQNVSIRNIFYVLEESILSKPRYNIQSPQHLNSKLFWKVFLPREIVKVGLYNNIYEIKILEKLIE